MDKNLYEMRLAQFRCYSEASGNYSSAGNNTCPRVWDSLICWEQQQASTKVNRNCPSYVQDFDPKEHAFKICLPSGQWFRHPDTGKAWTNYTKCKIPDIRETTQVQFYLTMSGFAISFIALIIAMIVFVRFRALQCQRVTIHKNLFVSYIVSTVVAVMWLFSMRSSSNNEVYCKALLVVLQYAQASNHYWMLCEGIYLHSFVVLAVFREKQKMWLYVVLGWVTPLIPTTIYVFAKVYLDGIHYRCWIFSPSRYVEYIIYGPMIGALLINFWILLSVLKVLVGKLRTLPGNDCRRYIRATRAALVLIPLLGAHHLLLSLGALSDDHFVRTIFYYIQIVVNSLQGFAVAVIFCFCHDEVSQVIARFFSKRCGSDRRLVPDRFSRSSGSQRNQGSFGTATTQMESVTQAAETEHLYRGSDM